MTSTNQFVQDQHNHKKTPHVFNPYSDDTQNKNGKLCDNNDNNDLNVIEKDPKTPTAPEAIRRRSEEIGVCPPAPRKAKSLALKRKWSPDNQTNSTNNNNNNKPSAYRLLDFTKEIESMYPPLLQANLGRKIKKARTN